MRIKIWTIAAFVLLVILVSFYFFDHLGDGENSRALGVTLTKVNESNPADDARQNILNGDTRYIGLMGYGVYCPGLPSDQHPNNYRILAGTSDVVESQYHRRLLKRALQYATEYNVELHSRLNKTSGSSP